RADRRDPRASRRLPRVHRRGQHAREDDQDLPRRFASVPHAGLRRQAAPARRALLRVPEREANAVRAALIGFPQSGKTTTFQVLTENPQAVARRQEDAVGMARVRDPRLDRLHQLFQPKKTTPVAHEIVDPASAFPRVGTREELGDKDPYPALRAADLLVLVLRAFDDPSVPHPSGSVDPERDRAQIEEELVLSDLVLVDTRLERIVKLEKIGKKSENPIERPLLQKLHEALEAGKPIRLLELSREEEKALRGFGFLSHKPVLAVYNHGEGAPPA